MRWERCASVMVLLLFWLQGIGGGQSRIALAMTLRRFSAGGPSTVVADDDEAFVGK